MTISAQRFFSILALLAATSGAAKAGVLPPLSQETVVVAKSTHNALLIWDATSDIIAMKQDNLSEQKILTTLERRAVEILQAKAPILTASATSATVRISYQKTGAISPTYGTATFEGIEQLATVSTPSLGSVQHLTPAQIDAIPTGKDFPEIKVHIVGQLPPSH